jgi:hypothetical protein
MKFICQILALVLILSLISCSLRRRKSQTKTKVKTIDDRYGNSELEIAIERIAQKMCLKVGRQATYVFFENILPFIQGRLPANEASLYEEIFENSFRAAISTNKIDLRLIKQQIMTTAQAVLGGNSPLQSPAYWKAYSQQMTKDNQRYLQGLVTASRGQSAGFKSLNDKVDTAGKFLENGFRGGIHEVAQDAIGGGGIASMVSESIIDVVIYLIQRKMVNNAKSEKLIGREFEAHADSLERQLLRKNGGCGKKLPSSETEMDGAHSPFYYGKEKYI